ncbi:MAG: phosphopentomutase [Bacilli bacterium]|nr:phosphopentomutase [Bacilli bacterium]
MKFKRIFLMVLDGLGVGEASDASNYGDTGSNTLGHIKEKYDLFIPNLKKIGFLDTLNMNEDKEVEAYYTIASPINAGKDSLNGHYEMMGIKNNIPFKTFNKGFSPQLVSGIEQLTGRKVIGNKCSIDGLSIINELGERQQNYGSLIVYTSADSDLQIAAHEDCIPISTLYQYCERIRAVTLRDEWRVGRVIARPFNGKVGHYKLLNSARRDYAVKPPTKSILDNLIDAKYNVIGIGKVNDIFDGQGINKVIKANSNSEAINKFIDIIDKKFTGLCIVNLADFDGLYGHTRDVEGYGKAIEELDVDIPIILNKLETDDLLIITADHGNDPTFDGNDHTRENVPVILYSRNFKEAKRLEPFNTLANIGATIADNFEVNDMNIGMSILEELE